MTVVVYDNVLNGLDVTKTVDLAGDTTTSLANGDGRVLQTVDGLGKVFSATYDANGRLLSQADATAPERATLYGVDLGRRVSATDLVVTGRATAYAYDVAGRLLSTTDAVGVTTTYTYDQRDRKLSESTPMSGGVARTMTYAYDADGDLLTLTDANGAVTTWTYDARNRPVTKTYANGDNRSMAARIAARRLVTLTDENGDVITSTYDLAGRMVAKNYSVDTANGIAGDSYAYDAASRVVSVTKGRYNHTLNYAYDSAGRLSSETHPDGESLTYAYDAVNRLSGLGVANGLLRLVARHLRCHLRLRRAEHALERHSPCTYATSYLYQDNGQVASTIDYQVANAWSDILRMDRTYDGAARA